MGQPLENWVERVRYANEDGNWEVLEQSHVLAKGGKPLFRLERLKRSRVMRLLVLRCKMEPIACVETAPPWEYVLVATFHLNENGCMGGRGDYLKTYENDFARVFWPETIEHWLREDKI